MNHYRIYLESVVLGEGDDLHDLSDPWEDLVYHIQCYGVDHVLHNHAQHRVRSASLIRKKYIYIENDVINETPLTVVCT